MKINMNNYVRIKLTDKGREILKSNHGQLNFEVHGFLCEYNPLKEDNEGWSTWQLWHLFQEFGSYIYNGCEVPFETEIDIIEK